MKIRKKTSGYWTTKRWKNVIMDPTPLSGLPPMPHDRAVIMCTFFDTWMVFLQTVCKAFHDAALSRIWDGSGIEKDGRESREPGVMDRDASPKKASKKRCRGRAKKRPQSNPPQNKKAVNRGAGKTITNKKYHLFMTPSIYTSILVYTYVMYIYTYIYIYICIYTSIYTHMYLIIVEPSWS